MSRNDLHLVRDIDIVESLAKGENNLPLVVGLVVSLLTVPHAVAKIDDGAWEMKW